MENQAIAIKETLSDLHPQLSQNLSSPGESKSGDDSEHKRRLEKLKNRQSNRFDFEPPVVPDWYRKKLDAAAEKEKCEFKISPDLVKSCFWESLKKVAAKEHREFEVDSSNKYLLQSLNGYLCEVTGVFDPSKGIALIGATGTGKTLLMKSLQLFYNTVHHPTRRFRINNALDVFQEVQAAKGDMTRFVEDNRCFDDFGMEQDTMNNYGNIVEVFSNIIYQRERKRLLTHITSNLNKDELEQKYGTRTVDRMKTMFNIFELTGSSRRR